VRIIGEVEVNAVPALGEIQLRLHPPRAVSRKVEVVQGNITGIVVIDMAGEGGRSRGFLIGGVSDKHSQTLRKGNDRLLGCISSEKIVESDDGGKRLVRL